jgi:mRNA-degrading endonuclease RelE of RelBE toxin-antitoxin system
MSYSIFITKNFTKELKQLIKKYRSLKMDLVVLKNELLEKPDSGIHIGGNIYKIRLAIKSKGRGKSGGARVITYFKLHDNSIYLLSIYDKSEKDSISNMRIKELLDQIDKSNLD